VEARQDDEIIQASPNERDRAPSAERKSRWKSERTARWGTGRFAQGMEAKTGFGVGGVLLGGSRSTPSLVLGEEPF
jgi:hypothetical protein